LRVDATIFTYSGELAHLGRSERRAAAVVASLRDNGTLTITAAT